MNSLLKLILTSFCCWLTLPLVAATAFTPSAAQSNTIYVPDDHATIQAAIQATVTGDTVIVRSGTYYETGLQFLGRGIAVISESGPASTIIDGSSAGGVVSFGPGDGADAILEGFTITHGFGPWGGGISCSGNGCAPNIRNCVIVDNEAEYQGGGILSWNEAAPLISDCRIENNRLTLDNLYGAGVYCGSGAPRIEYCTIRANVATAGFGGHSGAGLYFREESQASLLHSIITENISGGGGGGLMCGSSNVIIDNCLISNNTAISASGTYGSGGGIFLAGSASPTISNCTIRGNDTSAIGWGGGITVAAGSPMIENCIVWGNIPTQIVSGSPTVLYSCIQGGWAGTGNISADPQFASGPSHDSYLGLGSPSIDAGNPAVPAFGSTDVGGADDVGVVDMGYHNVEIERRLIYAISYLYPTWPATFTAVNGTPGGVVLMGYSRSGPGPVNTRFGIADMSYPIFHLASPVANAVGTATATLTIPPNSSGITLYTQAVDLSSGEISNSLAEVIN
ncbi:MAG: right-handed parallel beta-helix repeat-containing protein [Planctomycetes bacterium]|nr:right-handed parallel beta-helix repeat-containing protein [Planctomycetota bacterium]